MNLKIVFLLIVSVLAVPEISSAQKLTKQEIAILRYISIEQMEKARAKMQAIVKESFPHTEAEINFTGGSGAMPPTPGNEKLLKILSQASQDLGQGKVTAFDPALRGGGDMTQIALVDGLG